MQNSNVSPEFMLKGSPLTPKRYAERPYLYNPDSPLHQRAAMTLRQLDSARKMTVQDAMAIALSTEVYNADLWQDRLSKAREKARLSGRAGKVCQLILRWDRRADADSAGAVAYRYWKQELGPQALLA